jgi:hypothetical protein
LSDVILSGFLRIVTNPRIFDPATPMETALAFCQRLVEWPRYLTWIGEAKRDATKQKRLAQMLDELESGGV